MLWWIVAPDTISTHDVSAKILRRFCAELSCPHRNFFKTGRAVGRLAFGFSGPPCFELFHGVLSTCLRMDSCRICLASPGSNEEQSRNQEGHMAQQSANLCIFLHCMYIYIYIFKGSLGGETSVLRTFRMSGKELVKERVSKERIRQGKSSSKKELVKEELVKERVSAGKS